MPDLGTWANLAEIVGGATVVGGLLFAGFEIHRSPEDEDPNGFRESPR